jgi:hypothetical protein
VVLTLAAVLDSIHESGGALGTAVAAALGLPSDELWRVAVLHLAGMLRQQPICGGSFGADRIRFKSFAVRLQWADASSGDIKYYDRDVSFHADGVDITNHDGPETLSDMLRLLQYARDHSDTLCYLPSEMRARRLEALSSDLGTSVPFTRFICAWFPSLQRTVIG